MTLEVTRTLKSIHLDNSRPIATLSAPVKGKFDNVVLDGESTKGTAEYDMLCTTVLDVETGTPINENVRGTVFLTPKGSDRVKVNIAADMKLLEAPEMITLSSNR